MAQVALQEEKHEVYTKFDDNHFEVAGWHITTYGLKYIDVEGTVDAFHCEQIWQLWW